MARWGFEWLLQRSPWQSTECPSHRCLWWLAHSSRAVSDCFKLFFLLIWRHLHSYVQIFAWKSHQRSLWSTISVTSAIKHSVSVGHVIHHALFLPNFCACEFPSMGWVVWLSSSLCVRSLFVCLCLFIVHAVPVISLYGLGSLAFQFSLREEPFVCLCLFIVHAVPVISLHGLAGFGFPVLSAWRAFCVLVHCSCCLQVTNFSLGMTAFYAILCAQSVHGARNSLWPVRNSLNGARLLLLLWLIAPLTKQCHPFPFSVVFHLK